MSLVKCNKCQVEAPVGDMFTIRNRGVVEGYECANEKVCRQRVRDAYVPPVDELKEMAKEFAGMSEEEQLQHRFGIEHVELGKGYCLFRDGNVLHDHAESGETYIWDMSHRLWIRRSDLNDPIYRQLRHLK